MAVQFSTDFYLSGACVPSGQTSSRWPIVQPRGLFTPGVEVARARVREPASDCHKSRTTSGQESTVSSSPGSPRERKSPFVPRGTLIITHANEPYEDEPVAGAGTRHRAGSALGPVAPARLFSRNLRSEISSGTSIFQAPVSSWDASARNGASSGLVARFKVGGELVIEATLHVSLDSTVRRNSVGSGYRE